MASPDNRKTPRIATPNVMVRVSTAERFRAAYLRDLSEGGLFIKTDKPLPLGREVTIDLLPPGFTLPLRLGAVVVRQGGAAGPGMGVSFQNLDPTAQEALRSVIASYANAAVPPNLPGPPRPDAARDLEVLLEQYAILKNTLETRDRELGAERTRREEASQRALKLAEDLEAQRTQADRSASNSPTPELQIALGEKQAELADARMRISELEGSLEAYQTEVQVLEEDDANSRRLASALAQEKLLLSEQAQRLSSELEHERKIARDRLGELEARLQMSDSAAREIIRSMQTDLDARQLAVTQHGTKASALEAQLNEQLSRQTTFDAELRALRTENTSLSHRLTHAEAAGKDATGRLERLKTKERELRELLAAVSARAVPAPGSADRAEADPDEVVIENGSSTPPEQTEAVAAALGAPDAVGLPQASAPVAPAEPQTATMPQTAAVPEPAGAPRASLPPSEEDLPEFDLNEDVDLSAEFPPAAADYPVITASEFERRLRANDELKKMAGFDDLRTGDDGMQKVKGLLEAGERFSELMVLGRGVVTPPQLLELLFKLHQAGVLTFR